MKFVLIILFFSIVSFSQNISNIDLNNFKTNIKLGSNYWKKSELDSALYFFEEAYKIADKNSNEINKASARLNISSIYIIKEDFNTALSLTKEIVKVFEKANDKEKMAICYNNFGLIYSSLNDNKNALINYNKSLKIKKQNKNINGYAKTLVNIGAIYGKEEKFEDELNYYFEALTIFTQKKDSFDLASTLYDVAKSYYLNKKYEQSETYIYRTIDIAQKIDAKTFISISNELLSFVKEETNDYKASLKYYKLYKQFSDTLLITENKHQYNSLLVKYETREYKTKAEFQAIQIKQKNNLIIFLSIAIILFVSLVLFITFFFLKQRKNNKILLNQNIELIKKEKELENYKEEVTVIKEDANKKNKDDLHYKLMLAINTDKIYRNKGITIFELADILNTNKTYLSKIINDNFNQNFNVFINSFRIKEAKKLLSSPENKKYTIASIADEVGFNSISAFNKVFKDITGLTPSYFMKNIKT